MKYGENLIRCPACNFLKKAGTINLHIGREAAFEKQEHDPQSKHVKYRELNWSNYKASKLTHYKPKWQEQKAQKVVASIKKQGKIIV